MFPKIAIKELPFVQRRIGMLLTLRIRLDTDFADISAPAAIKARIVCRVPNRAMARGRSIMIFATPLFYYFLLSSSSTLRYGKSSTAGVVDLGKLLFCLLACSILLMHIPFALDFANGNNRVELSSGVVGWLGSVVVFFGPSRRYLPL